MLHLHRWKILAVATLANLVLLANLAAGDPKGLEEIAWLDIAGEGGAAAADASGGSSARAFLMPPISLSSSSESDPGARPAGSSYSNGFAKWTSSIPAESARAMRSGTR